MKTIILCPAIFFGKHLHNLKPFALTQIGSESVQLSYRVRYYFLIITLSAEFVCVLMTQFVIDSGSSIGVYLLLNDVCLT